MFAKKLDEIRTLKIAQQNKEKDYSYELMDRSASLLKILSIYYIVISLICCSTINIKFYKLNHPHKYRLFYEHIYHVRC